MTGKPLISISVQGVEALKSQLAQMEADLKRARIAGMEQATIATRDELFKAMSGVAIPDPFWGVKSPPGNVLAARSGHTRNALTPGRVWTIADVTFGAVGHDEPHVAALETGETIRPKTGQYLRIPTANALTPAGVDRWTGTSIRTIPGARLVRTKRGNLWAVRDVGGPQSRAIEFLYLLVRSVKLPEKRIFATVRGIMEPKIATIFEAKIEVVMLKGFRMRGRAA